MTYVHTLYPQALLVLNDEVFLTVLQLPEVVLGVLHHDTQFLKCLVDLLVSLRGPVHWTRPWTASLITTNIQNIIHLSQPNHYMNKQRNCM